MITPNQTEIDLGSMAFGTSKLFDIEVSNTYDKIVAVGLAFGCASCTNGNFYPDNNIPAGGYRTLKLKFTPTSRGPQAKSVRLNHLPPGGAHAHKTIIRFKAEVT